MFYIRSSKYSHEKIAYIHKIIVIKYVVLDITNHIFIDFSPLFLFACERKDEVASLEPELK